MFSLSAAELLSREKIIEGDNSSEWQNSTISPFPFLNTDYEKIIGKDTIKL